MSGARRAAWRALQVVLLVAVVWGIWRALAPDLAKLTWADVLRWRPDPWVLLASFALLLGVYIAHAFLWRRIMRDLEIGDPPARVVLRVYFAAGLGRYLPGRLWQLAGLAVLARRAGLPPGSAAAAQVLGQFGFLTTGLLFLGLTLPEWRYALGETGASADVGPLALGAALLVGAGLALWITVATPIGHGLRERLERALGERGGQRLHAAFALADRVRPPHALLWALGYAASWVALGCAFALFVAAFVPAAVESFRFIAGTVAASYLVGYIAVFAPAGVGIREAAMVLLLQRVLPDFSAALVVSVLSRVWFTAAELVPLAFVPALPAGEVLEEEQG